jgi:ubiquinone/menaquinone biosynthesis C-methylase UbiE
VRAEVEGFQKTSHEYERGRPGYPRDSVDWIIEKARLEPGTTVVDLAAGTGKLTVELTSSGARVVAIEPLAEMRARLSERLPDVEVRQGLAEATGLASDSADAVTIAQAFHWFANGEALAEIHRILRPGGLMFLIWNRRDVADPVQAEISRLCAPFIGSAPSYGSGRWRDVMGESSRFELAGEHHARMDQQVDRDGLVARVASTSYIANLPDEDRLPLLDAVAALMGDNEVVTLPYSTATFAYRAR